MKSKKQICDSCGRFFISPGAKKYCTELCRKQSAKDKHCKTEEEKIISHNKSWINNELPRHKLEKASHKGRVSYEEQIRRMEIKRVFDDEGWKHYIKGRKWDKI